MPKQGVCGCCGESYPGDDLRETGQEGFSVCQTCMLEDIVKQFKAAYDHEYIYNEYMRGTLREVKVENFADVLPPDFPRQFRLREESYRVLPVNRRHCGHREVGVKDGTYGEMCSARLYPNKPDLPPAEEHFRCNTCAKLTCRKCELPIEPSTHKCGLVEKVEGESPPDGREYQKCPRCTVPVSLYDGCNHMTCPQCEEQFCYICGQPATTLSGHWDQGNPCPKYNRPGEPNALFDRPRLLRVIEVLLEHTIADPRMPDGYSGSAVGYRSLLIRYSTFCSVLRLSMIRAGLHPPGFTHPEERGEEELIWIEFLCRKDHPQNVTQAFPLAWRSRVIPDDNNMRANWLVLRLLHAFVESDAGLQSVLTAINEIVGVGRQIPMPEFQTRGQFDIGPNRAIWDRRSGEHGPDILTGEDLGNGNW